MAPETKLEFSKQTNRQLVPPSFAFTLVRANNVLPWLTVKTWIYSQASPCGIYVG
jgi:hypothetical protein